MLARLAQLKKEASQALGAITAASDLEAWRIRYIGRKGVIPMLLRKVKDLSSEERKKVGAAANSLRRELEEKFQQKQSLLQPALASSKNLKPLTSNLASIRGHLHPITLAIRRIQEIMSAMGFVMVEGPEVEEEYFDFDALNIPLEHPARAETDSFYVHPRRPNGQGLVLRTSTSAVQVRAVIEEHLIPPFKIASAGRVFRNEKTDATHESSFHQIEALMIGKSVTVADYRGVTETLFSTFFGKDARIRLRPGYFPFVEPGFEVDMTCVFCNDGCRICKYTGWIEMGGAGMVHPNVLKNMNVDPAKFQGFAFGYGIDRLAMLWHGIDDVRLFWSGDIRFLSQFS